MTSCVKIIIRLTNILTKLTKGPNHLSTWLKTDPHQDINEGLKSAGALVEYFFVSKCSFDLMYRAILSRKCSIRAHAKLRSSVYVLTQVYH